VICAAVDWSLLTWKQEITRSKTREFLRAKDAVGPAGTPVTVSVDGITNMPTDIAGAYLYAGVKATAVPGSKGSCRGLYDRFCRRFDRLSPVHRSQRVQAMRASPQATSCNKRRIAICARLVCEQNQEGSAKIRKGLYFARLCCC
jgi:hypothetical protein